LENSADRLLLDVPCSGLGVLKRNPDAKWKLSPEFVANVKELQQHILQDYGSMLKKDGLMVYSTCSVLPSENEKQVENFLSTNNDKFELIEQKYSWPSEGFDGFYMALLRKK
jgi:16S rRNA (cytosine967-C5)-methyltransferase